MGVEGGNGGGVLRGEELVAFEREDLDELAEVVALGAEFADEGSVPVAGCLGVAPEGGELVGERLERRGVGVVAGDGRLNSWRQGDR